MRHKKVLVLVTSDGDERSILSFMLACNGYKVYSFDSAGPAIQFISENSYELLLTVYMVGSYPGDALVVHSKRIDPFIPAILLTTNDKPLPNHHADLCLTQPVTAAELLERIRVMSARKRGPKRGTHRQPKPVVSVPAEVDQPAALATQGA